MDLFILDRDFKTVSLIDRFESMIWTDRYSAYGDFEFYTPYSKTSMEVLKSDYYVWLEKSDHIMIIEDRKIVSDVEEGTYFLVTGRSLESILDRRIVWDQTNLDGYLEGQIKKLLDQNVINPSDPKRKIPNLIFEYSNDSYIASLKIQMQITGDTVYDTIKKICNLFGIGFKITLNTNNQMMFQLYNGEDRSYAQNKNPYVVFSPNFENVINTNYYESKKSLKTITLVAGEGEGANRKTVTVGDEVFSGLDRRELYTDARDISSVTQEGNMSEDEYNYLLIQRGNEKLSENKNIQAFDGQVEATQLYIYGKDFFMGDIVELEDYEMTSRIRVTEYIISEDQNGLSIYPTFEVVEEEVT